MRGYFERLENCHHRPKERLLGETGLNLSRHGWAGWLQTEKAIPPAALGDRDCGADAPRIGARGFRQSASGIALNSLVQGQLDPNDWRLVKDNAVGAATCL